MTAWRLSILAERQMEHLLGVSIRDYGTAHARNYVEILAIVGRSYPSSRAARQAERNTG